MKPSLVLLVLTFLVAGQAWAQDRMPPIPAEKMTDAQKKAVADYFVFITSRTARSARSSLRWRF